MTLIVAQHVPSFVSGFEPERATVETVADLLALPWVASWKEPLSRHTFDRFCWSWAWDKAYWHLMVECDGGRWWWVLARVEGDSPTDLHEWVPPAAIVGHMHEGIRR